MDTKPRTKATQIVIRNLCQETIFENYAVSYAFIFNYYDVKFHDNSN